MKTTEQIKQKIAQLEHELEDIDDALASVNIAIAQVLKWVLRDEQSSENFEKFDYEKFKDQFLKTKQSRCKKCNDTGFRPSIHSYDICNHEGSFPPLRK